MAHALGSTATILAFPVREAPAAARQPAPEWDVLDLLRRAALRARLSPGLEPERACEGILTGTGVSAEHCARQFFRALRSAARADLELHHPGVRHATPDESWLLALMAAFRRADESSASMLISPRLRPLGRNRMTALARGLANALDDLSMNQRNSLAG